MKYRYLMPINSIKYVFKTLANVLLLGCDFCMILLVFFENIKVNIYVEFFGS